MSTHVVTYGDEISPPAPARLVRYEHVARYLVPLARVCFSLMFLMATVAHFTEPLIAAAEGQGAPGARVLVPLSGIIAGVGGLSIVLGYHARIGAWLIVAFLVPITLIMHPFWAIADPTTAMMQQTSFMKNLSMLGGALFIAYYGAGPISIDAALAGRVHPPEHVGMSTQE